MKFNYKDKSPKIDLPTGNIPKDLYEDKDPANNLNTPNFEETNTNPEIKIDIPSFEESMKEENNNFQMPTMDFQENDKPIFSNETPNIYEENSLFGNSSPTFTEPSVESPIELSNETLNTHEENSLFENNAPSFTEPSIESPIKLSNEIPNTYEEDSLFTNNSPTFTEPAIENSVDFSNKVQNTNNEDVLFENNNPSFTEQVSDNTTETPLDASFDENFSQQSSFFSNPYNVESAIDNSVKKEQPIIETDNNPIFDTDSQLTVQNDISIDEVFDQKEIKKEKKSLFGKKKEKTPKEKPPKEEKPKKEKKSLFGKKNKKTELQNKLDEITQDAEEPAISSSLFEDLIEQPQETVLQNQNAINDESIPMLDLNKEQEAIEDNAPPMFMDLETSVPLVDDLQTVSQQTPIFNNENTPSTPLVENTVDFTPQPTTPQPTDSMFGSFNEPTSIINDTISNTSTDEMEVLRDNAKKKKKNPIVIVLVLVAIVAILLVFCVVKLLSPSDGGSNVQQPVEIPPTSTEVEIDNDTVNSLVEETQQIVDNANNVADTYVENNDLPPQVGVDIDEEIAEENTTKKNKTKTFTDTGITFDYPAEWTEITAFNTRETDSNVKNIIMLGLTPLDADDTNNMRVTTEETVKSITSKEYFKNTEELMKKSFTNIKTRKSTELTIAGREAPSRIYTFTDESGNSVEQFQVYVASGKNIYVITFTSSEENFVENLETYKSILKTIQIK